jgi:SAM-dependent methyltransferase
VDSALYEEFAAVEREHWWFQGRRAIVADVLERWLPPPPLRILDIGCGTGEMLDMLTHFGDVLAMDSSPAAVAFCHERFGTTAEVVQGYVPDDLPTGELFDVVSAFDVIEHLDDDRVALRRLRSLTAPGGMIVVTVPAFQFLWSAHDVRNHHRRRYTRPELRARLLEAGYEVPLISYFNTFLFPPAALGRLLQRLRRVDHTPATFSLPSSPANAGLKRVFAAERFVLRRGRFPFGVSILAIGRA